MNGGVIVGTVRSLARFPVKSTAGETLACAEVTERGLLHDREWAIYTDDAGIASGKTTRRFRKVEGLLGWRSTMSAETGAGASPLLHSPDGASHRADDPSAAAALSRAFGRELTPRREHAIRHHDECPVHVVTTASIRQVERLVGGGVDVRRLRANVILDTRGTGFVEDAWTGAELAIGLQVVLRLGPGMRRCVMVDQPAADVAAGLPLLHALGRSHEAVLGLQAQVVRGGTIGIGDIARLTLPG